MTRRLLTIIVALFELIVYAAFITVVLPAWTKAQVMQLHPASEPAARALQERHDRVAGTVRPPAHQHFITELQVPGSPTIRTETFMSQPDRIFVRTEVAGELLFEFGFDGTTGWSNSPMTGLVRVPSTELETLRATTGSGSQPALDSTVPYRATGRRTFDGQLVDGIRAITAAGDTAEVFYAVSTGLMAGFRVRRVARPPLAAGDSLVMLLRDYKRVDGRMGSTTMVYRGMGMESVARTVHLDHAAIAPARFKPPAGLP